MKKLLTSLLCVVMVVCFMPTMAFAAETTEANAVAKVTAGETVTYYDSLSDAVQNANGATITLLKDIEQSSTILINNGLKVTIDLNNNDIRFDLNKFFRVQGGSLTLTGEGLIEEKNPNFGPIVMKGSPEKTASSYSVVNIGKDVTLKGWSALFIDQAKTADNTATSNYGIVANVSGALITVKDTAGAPGSGIYVNGSINNTEGSIPKITLDGATISAPEGGQGMYLAGYADTTVSNSTITSNQEGGTGIEIRAGKLAISDSSVTGGAGSYQFKSNGDGSASTNVALAVAQHGTGLPIDVTVNSGEFTGGAAFAEANPENNTTDEIKEVNVQILDGTYTGTISSDDKTGFVKGGTFSAPVEADYLPAGTTTEQNEDGKFVLAPAADAVAQIGNVGFATIDAALAAAKDGDKITLIKDINTDPTPATDVASGGKGYTVSKDITIDLNGKSITTTTEATLIVAKGAKLTVDDSSEPKTGTITGGTVGIKMGNASENGQDANSELIVNNGKISGGSFGISGNGLRHGTTITVNGGEITGTSTGIYHPQDGTLTINGGKVTGNSGIEIRSGNLVVNDGEIVGTATTFSSDPNGNGTTTDGAGIAIVQHTTQKPIDVQIKGGDMKGIYAIYEKNTQGNPAEAIAKVKVEITDGNFVATGDKAVESQTQKGFIKGGTFNKELDKEYLASGVTQNSNGTVTTQYIPTIPTTQKPIIESADNATVTLSTDGTQATIKVADGYELVDVTVNGVSKGKVETLTGLKTGDKIVVKTQKKADDNAALIEAVKNTKLVARTEMSKAKGKKAVKVYWYAKDGSELNFDGYEVYRSLKRYEGFGTKPFFKTAKEKYYNTAIKKGTKYYYKVRAYKVIDGEKVYTDWSTKAWRTVK